MGGKTKNWRESEKGRERNNKEREIKKNLKKLRNKKQKRRAKGKTKWGREKDDKYRNWRD